MSSRTLNANELMEFAKHLEEFYALALHKINLVIRAEVGKTYKKAVRYTPKASGDLRKSWYLKESGNVYKTNFSIEIGNSSNYAKFVEEGFESHFVPGFWSGKKFIYDPNSSTGMYVGKAGTRVRGRFMLKRATKGIEKRMDTEISKILGRAWRDLRYN